jgi:hypothetical protein
VAASRLQDYGVDTFEGKLGAQRATAGPRSDYYDDVAVIEFIGSSHG